MNADLVRDLLHLERLQGVRTDFEEIDLVVDNRLADFRKRGSALFNRFDQPLGGADLPFDVVACFFVGILFFAFVSVIIIDRQIL